jgi:hypothetical protein
MKVVAAQKHQEMEASQPASPPRVRSQFEKPGAVPGDQQHIRGADGRAEGGKEVVVRVTAQPASPMPTALVE